MITLEVRLSAIRYEARGIHSFELCSMPGQELPAFTAGAHIDVHLPNGMIRSYSLANSPGEHHRYVIAVNRDPNSRGGSKYMHEQLKVGSVLRVTGPRNNFPLNEEADHTILIAGGIGVTPMRSMMMRLQTLGRSWDLFYATRDRQCTAFLAELSELHRVSTNVHFNFDGEPGGQMLDIERVMRSAPPTAHVYCCGPLPMLAAFESAAASLPQEQIHLEYFAAKEQPAVSGGFEVELARSKRVIEVPQGKTILDALLENGVDVPYSCMEGVCASCETRVISGTPDHRDLVLSKTERAANDRMMICCSGSKSPVLTLDL